MYVAPTRHTNKTQLMGDPICDAHAKHNFDICRAINMTSLSIVLDKLVEEGKMAPNTRDIYKMQAQSLLASLLTENHRIHGF